MLEKNYFVSLKNRPSISLLLGAGFSVPMGYPTAEMVNKKLIGFDFNCLKESPAGELFYCKESGIIKNNYYRKNIVFCQQVINKYVTLHNNAFDYEKFYDFIFSPDIYNQPYCDISDSLHTKKERYCDLVDSLRYLFVQMLPLIIKDKNGNVWYDNKPTQIGHVNEYDTLLSNFSIWIKEGYIINVHTLNHDMLFESFNKTEYLSGMICDGFDEFGSDYYGELLCNGISNNVRLERYSARYNKPVRLYKLHGSFDYVLFYRQGRYSLIPNICIKTKYGIDFIKHSIRNKMKYEIFPFAYNPYCLSGISTKRTFYKDKVFFDKLHKRFQRNLDTAEKLIIIGYGGKDEGINEELLNNYEYDKKTTIIIDPNPSDSLLNLSLKMNAKLIKKSVSDISMSDLQ